MKILRVFLGLASTAFLAACAVTEQSVEEVGHQFTEGAQGRGHIVENDPTQDSFGPMYR